MADIEKTLVIAAPISKVWAALTHPDILGEYLNDSMVEVDLCVGGEYAFFSGETTGHFTNISKPNLLEYTWRQTNWPKSWQDSLVRWELNPKGKGTEVYLVHSRFPNDEESNSHDEGWDIYFIEPLREWLEDDL